LTKHIPLYLFGLVLTLFTSCGEQTANNQNATNDPDSLNGKENYVNPVDGKTYSAKGGFTKYEPDGGVKPVSGTVKTLNIVLLTEQDKLERIIGVERLANFIKSMDTIVDREFAGVKEKGEILIQFTLYADKKPSTIISFSGNVDTLCLSKTANEIDRLSASARTLEDSCTYQSHYGVNIK
jgi:hypothetical protein